MKISCKRLVIVTVCLLIFITFPLKINASSKLEEPKIKSINSVNARYLKITWKECQNVSGYIIYRDNKKLNEIKNRRKTIWIDKKVEFGKKYKYSIRSYKTYKNKRIYSARSKNVTGSIKLGSPKLTPIKYWSSAAPFASGQEYRTTWKKVQNADGYIVETKEYGWDGSNGYSYLKRTKQRYASIQFSDVYKFGFRVRAYKVVKGKNVYGPYSQWVWKKMY